MSATAMSKDLQNLLNQLKDGEPLKLEPPRGEFAGPIVLRKPVLIDGQGGSIHAKTGPILQIESRGVVLRDLCVEITSSDPNLTGEGACALKIQPGLAVDLNNIIVHGAVIGLSQEEGVWHLPRILRLNAVRASIPHEFRVKIVTPVPCSLTSDIDGLKVQPHDLAAGVNVVTLRLDALPAGTILRGQLQLRTRQLVRRIVVNGRFADTGTSGNGQFLWRPPGDADATPAGDSPVPSITLDPIDPAGDTLAPPTPLTMPVAPATPLTMPVTPLTMPATGPAAPTTPVAHDISPAVGPEVLIVSAFDTGQFRTIGDALQRARTGARVLIRPGVYRESLTIHRRVELVGDGPSAEVVVESPDGNCLLLQTDMVRVRSLTLRGGAGRSGRERYAVHAPRGQMILEDCSVTSDSLACLTAGGAGTTLVMRRCRVQGGASTGVLVLSGADAVLEDCDVGEQALAGVESRRATVTMRHCRITGCGQAGILAHDHGKVALETCDLHGNARAGVESRESGDVVLRRCKVRENQGPGVRVHADGKATLEECDLFANTLANLEVRLGGNPTLRRCKVRMGKQAGALFGRDSQGTVEDCEFTGNTKAAVEIKENGNPTLRRCTVRQSGDVGVAVRDRGRGLLEECDLSEARLAVLEVRQSAAPVLKRCKVSDGARAGVLVASRGGGRLEDCEVFANQGPGVVIAGESNPTLKRCKVFENGQAGIVVGDNGRGVLEQCEMTENGLAGLVIGEGAAPNVKSCKVTKNRDVGLWAKRGAEGNVEDCDLTGNRQGPLDVEGGAGPNLSNNKTER
jgi:F-box protein 11